MSSEKPKRILIRLPNWVGDVIMALPAAECLHNHFPDAEIHALTRPYTAKIISDIPWLTSVIPCDDKASGAMKKVTATVRDAEADLAIVFPNSIRSFMPFKRARVPRIVGYRRGVRKPFIEGPLPKRTEGGKFLPLPMVDYYLGLCEWLGADINNPPRPRLYISPELQARADELLARYGIAPGDRVIGLNPGAKFGSSKCWPPEYFGKLADLIESKTGAKQLLFVGPGESPIADAIMASTKAAVINTDADKVDLELLKPMIARCDLLVTNDTGPRHYATAFDIPTVVLMGPTDPRWTASYLDKTVVLRKELDCSPCHKKECKEDHKCMRAILPDEVMNAIASLLHRKGETGQ